MNVRKFTASTTHAATLEVRKALGREAIIIANRKTDNGVEIIATDNMDDLNADLSALDLDTEPSNNAVDDKKSKRVKRSGSKKAAVATAVTDTAEVVRAAPVDNASHRTNELQREIADLHGALEGLARSGALTMTTNISEITLAGRLMACGLGPTLVQQLVESARPVAQVDSAWQKALKNLNKQLRFKPGDFIEEGGTYFFHGSAGAGKTTAICKLATEFLATNPPGKLAIVVSGEKNSLTNEDSLLTAYSQLLHIPVLKAGNAAELDHVLRQLRRKKMILIDTPALVANDLASHNSVVFKHHAKRRIEHCLVVSASIQGGLLDHLFGCLAESPIESVILTHVDETRQIGVSIDSILRSGLQLRYCSDTPNLHCMLHNTSAELLMSRLAAFSPLSSAEFNTESLTKNAPAPVANWLESAILL